MINPQDGEKYLAVEDWFIKGINPELRQGKRGFRMENII